ncbi:MAG: hypothetical protein FJW86_06705 [Actinobacteria bacterium]|nr:hypothetical protein [Actinomycetota bacterium]
MYVQIDLAPHPPVVTLEDPNNTKQFHVAVMNGTTPEADFGLIFGALVDAAAGRLEGDDAYITIDAVRRMARDRVQEDWNEEFDAMLSFAKKKGWLDEGSNAIKAHIERP